MASSIGRERDSTASPSIKDLIHGAPGSLIDGLVILAIGLSVGLYFGFSNSAREWAIEALGYGWVPAGILVAVTLVTLRYNRRVLFTHWRRWVIAVALAAISISVLSTIFPSDGALEDVSLGGKWGAYLGGTPAVLAAAKMAAIALAVPLIIRPKRFGMVYLRYAKAGLLGLQLGLLYSYLGLQNSARFIDRRVRILRYGMHRQASRRDLLKMLLMGPSKAPVRTLAYQGDPETAIEKSDFDGPDVENGLDTLVQDNEEDDWDLPESRLIPTWGTKEPAPRKAPKPTKAIGDGAETGKRTKGRWQTPPVDMLTPPDTHHAPEAALQEMARLVETTLGDHGVRVEVTDVKAGPRIVRFGLVPGWVPKRGGAGRSAIGLDTGDADPSALERSRVKVQSILTREKDMALALKTPYLRIEAPVPGEALVGLEVPSPSPSKVHLREVMETPIFKKLVAKGGLPIALGQDTGGTPVVLDLAALPHMLIAGATGSGKSVCINSIVASFLLTKTPEQLRILMVDQIGRASCRERV